MNKVLILGASGAIAQHTIEKLQKNNKLELTLFARNANKINQFKNETTQIFQGDVLNESDLDNALKGQDIVYANLAGETDKMAEAIVKTMNQNGVKRLIFITSLGIYDEVPGKFGEWNSQMIGGYLGPFKRAAEAIENSNLDYTIVRPAWLYNSEETEYETTQKGEDFGGTEISRKAVGTYVANVIENPENDVRASVGINKPNTKGNKPSFY